MVIAIFLSMLILSTDRNWASSTNIQLTSTKNVLILVTSGDNTMSAFLEVPILEEIRLSSPHLVSHWGLIRRTFLFWDI